jgi:hypothetical protein
MMNSNYDVEYISKENRKAYNHLFRIAVNSIMEALMLLSSDKYDSGYMILDNFIKKAKHNHVYNGKFMGTASDVCMICGEKHPNGNPTYNREVD